MRSRKEVRFKKIPEIDRGDIKRNIEILFPVVYQFIPVLLMLILNLFAGKQYTSWNYLENLIIICIVDLSVFMINDDHNEKYKKGFPLLLFIDSTLYILMETGVVEQVPLFNRLIFQLFTIVVVFFWIIYRSSLLVEMEA